MFLTCGFDRKKEPYKSIKLNCQVMRGDKTTNNNHGLIIQR